MTQPREKKLYQNPILPGFHPDPSICRVDKDYYLVTSSFEYFPGVPIYHSRDLVHWRAIGHCLTRASQLPLEHAPSSAGIYAPTIRYHEGTFYMITTNVAAGGNFYVTAKDPAGAWSEPIWVDQDGIDPSLLFDDDGRVYLSSSIGGAEGYIGQSEIDIKTGTRKTDVKKVWAGTGGQYPEAPHLYKIRGRYYLMIAEGGTDWGHMETIAVSDNPWGPFTLCPHNPILTHRSSCHAIQCTGHADLLEAHDGSWWLFFLGTRPCWNWHHLGRETFMAPVAWTPEGWPIVGRHGMADEQMEAPFIPEHAWEIESSKDNFDDDSLRLCWNFLRNPNDADWSLTERPGWLVLHGTDVTLSEVDSPAFVGRRQQHVECKAEVYMDFEPTTDGQEAGITALMNERHHYDIAVTQKEGCKCVIVRRTIGTLSAIEKQIQIGPGPIRLWIKADQETYYLGYNDEVLGQGEMRYLSKEVAGGFTGVYLGMYATRHAHAAFDWFDYSS